MSAPSTFLNGLIKSRPGLIRGRKAYLFLVDAILASLLLIMAVLVMTTSSRIDPLLLSQDYTAYDIATVLSTLRVGEVNNTFVSQLIANGSIKEANNSIMEQIGEFFAVGQDGKAERLFAEFVEGLLDPGIGYGLYIEGQPVYVSAGAPASYVVSSRKMISGIQMNRTREGFIARATLIKSRKNTTQVLMGDVVLSSVRKPQAANNLNEVNVSYNLTLPDNINIIDAWWFIQAAWTDNKFKAYINGDFIPGSSASGSATLENLGGYLRPGYNQLDVLYRFGSGGYEGGDDGASHFVVEYMTNLTSTLQDFKRKYFASVTSRCSIRYKKPIFVMGNLQGVNVNITAVGTTALLKYVIDGEEFTVSLKNITDNKVQWSDAEILAAFQAQGFSYGDASDKYIWFVVDIDEYNQRELIGDVRQILPGSYVEVETDLSHAIYGYIDVTKVVEEYTAANHQWGGFYRNLTWTFNLSEEIIPIMLDSQLAWLWDTSKSPYQEVRANANRLYMHPPQQFIPELVRYGYKPGEGNLVNGTNNFYLEFGDGYAIHPDRSLVLYVGLLRNLVPYGATFQTYDEAVADARRRLNETLSGYIDAIDISDQVTAVGGVPSMWGPLIAEVRTWK